jgi:hypothetical protein
LYSLLLSSALFEQIDQGIDEDQGKPGADSTSFRPACFNRCLLLWGDVPACKTLASSWSLPSSGIATPKGTTAG